MVGAALAASLVVVLSVLRASGLVPAGGPFLSPRRALGGATAVDGTVAVDDRVKTSDAYAAAFAEETLAMPYDELVALLGRAKSVWESVRRGVDPCAGESGVTVRTREALAGLGRFVPAEVEETDVAADGTTKLLVRLGDGLAVEAVLIPHLELARTTLCLSTQVGCDRGCTFCATARMGLVRQLTSDEILAQVFLARRVAAARGGDVMAPLTNVVFMGMGDAGRNAAAVVRATTALVDQAKFGFSRSKVTISTVGPSPEAFEALEAAEAMLAWSVHSADDALRKALVPSTTHTMTELRDGLVRALDKRPLRKRTLMVAATLIAGVNDSDEDARKLAAFVSPLVDCARKLSIDLIPVNPTAHAPHFRRPSNDRIQAFVDTLRETEGRAHIAVRMTRGDDDNAACGQLLVSRKRQELEATLPTTALHDDDDDDDAPPSGGPSSSSSSSSSS